MANINREQERVYWAEDNGDGEYLFVLDGNDEMLWAAGYNHADRANELRDLAEYKKPDADLTGWAYGYLDDLAMAVTTLYELRESYECRFVLLGRYTDDVVGKLEEIFA